MCVENVNSLVGNGVPLLAAGGALSPTTSHLLYVCDGSERPQNAQRPQGRYVERAGGSESLQDKAGHAL